MANGTVTIYDDDEPELAAAIHATFSTEIPDRPRSGGFRKQAAEQGPYGNHRELGAIYNGPSEQLYAGRDIGGTGK